MPKDRLDFMNTFFTKEERATRLKNIRKYLETAKDKIELNSEFGRFARELKGENGEHYLVNADGKILEIKTRIEEISKMSDKEVSGFSDEELKRLSLDEKAYWDLPSKKFQDKEFLYWDILQHAIIKEGENQVRKWGVQKHTLAEWLMYTTEELGELSKAISEYVYRKGTVSEIYREAIQTATLALKIAEMVFTQGTEYNGKLD